MPDGFSRATNHKSPATFYLASIMILLSSSACSVTRCYAQQIKKPFTVADEIGLTLFSIPGGEAPQVHFSPDGNVFVIWTERGRLDLNCVEDSLRFYRVQDIKNFLEHSDRTQPPSPVWVVNRSQNEGRIINDLHWLVDSSGVAFLERTAGDNQRLVLADLRRKIVDPLTLTTEDVRDFDLRDRQHYVYSVVDPAEREKRQVEVQSPAIVGTGRSLWELLFPGDPKIDHFYLSRRRYLKAAVGGKSINVKNDGAPLGSSLHELVLSPDGNSLLAKLLVADVPSSWETQYPPPYASSPNRIRAGGSANQYVRIDLQTGSVRALTDAPIGNDGGWVALGRSSWSSDGQAILLPDTFLGSKDHGPTRPCVAVLDLESNIRTCVEVLKGFTENGVEEGYHRIDDARFVEGDKNRVMVTFTNHEDQSIGTTSYRRATDGTWQIVSQSKGVLEPEHHGLEITVKQGLNEPPLLVATDKQASQVIWDPNPQLKSIDLGQAGAYTWKDKEGRIWKAGLYKPVDYKPGQRYPLVIQTHGFAESEFRPSGAFPTAYAARALAAAGIVVLQIPQGLCPIATPEEGSCVVSGYEAAVHQLVLEGLVDPENIGIIGFSWPCFHVMEALTTSSLHIRAASVTDGTMTDYFQHLVTAGDSGKGDSVIGYQDDAIVGARPFGEGLQQWLKRSPSFNLDKVTAPLLVVGEGADSLLFMWEPYAGLRYLHKSVDLIMLNTDEHVLTNPAIRMASQGGTMDWFRFWLKGEEDPNPAKADQYARWHELRKLQEANEHNGATPHAVSN